MSLAAPVLEIEDLRVELATRDGVIAPVDGASLQVRAGEIVGLVGESGSGKSLSSLAVMGLLPSPGGQVARGRIAVAGSEVDWNRPEQASAIRGRQVAMIFQDPMTSLNPYMRLGEQLIEAPMLHLGLARGEARDRAAALLDRVGLPDARSSLRCYPHELSGGMRQRVMIAMALLCEPELLIADEPTTALDVTTQAQILRLLAELRTERGTAILLITHDLAVVSLLCDRVVVMYAGEAVESAPARELFDSPQHPYTRALLACTPRIDGSAGALRVIEGKPPAPTASPIAACRFAPRCTAALEVCRRGAPRLQAAGPGRSRRCFVAAEDLP